MLTSEIARRLLSGIWFALAAVIPIVYFSLVISPGNLKMPLFGETSMTAATVPILLAGICGLSFGADILNRDYAMTILESVGRGAGIGLLSYLILFSGSAVICVLVYDDPIGLLIYLGLLFLYGLFFIGWIVGLTGAAAGGLLYVCRLNTAKR